MPNVPINITGGSYQTRSKLQSSQKTQNLYPEVVDNRSGRSPFILNGFPGKSVFSNGESGKDRGMLVHRGVLYKVTGSSLYSVDSSGVHTEIFNGITGTGRCVIEGMGADLIVVSEGNVWVYRLDPNVSDMAYTGLFRDVSDKCTLNRGLRFSDDGVYMYVIESTSYDEVYQYTLNTAWDVTTASYTSSLYVGGTVSSPASLTFGKSGEKMYIINAASQIVYEYSLSTAWDITAASYFGRFFDLSSVDASCGDMHFNSSGTKIYVVGGINDAVYELTIGDPWNIATASYAGTSLDVSTETTTPGNISIIDDSRIYISSNGGTSGVWQYSMTAGDLSTAAYDSSTYAPSQIASSVYGIHVSSDNTRMYLIGSNDNIVHQYTTFGEVTDADLESPNAVAHLNNQAIYDGDLDRWCVSDVGDATSINSLNYATAESSPDNLIRPYVFNQLLYLFGDETTETWYNSGVGTPPFDRIEQGIIPVGLGALHSTANTDNYLYFLGDDLKVYRLIGSNKQLVSDIGIVNQFESYTTTSDAIAFTYTFQNQNFYQLTFPTEGKTWVYSETAQQWFELSSSKSRDIANSYAYAYGKHLVADYRDGKIYELDMDVYDENGEEVERIRDTGTIHGELVGAPGKHVEMNRFELILQTGVGRVRESSDWDITDMAYVSKSASLGSQDSGMAAFTFNNDGTKLYAAGATSNTVYQYSLSTAYDVSTASYDSVSYDFSAQETTPNSIAFNNVGTSMFVMGQGNDTVYQYTLSTAWDVSTASYASKSLDLTSEDATPFGFVFSTDGTKLYSAGGTNDTIYQYTLTTAWDLSTASYASKSLDVSGQDTGPTGVAFSVDGLKMFMFGAVNSTVYQYTLTTAWDVSTASYDSISYDADSLTSISREIAVEPKGHYLYLLDSAPTLFQFKIFEPDNREDPVVMLSYSDDGGYSWSTERRGKLGRDGNVIRKVEWHGLGRFLNRIIRVKISDPVFVSIHEANADLEVGI